MTENERDKIRVIVCRVDERAEVIEIDDKLEAMQEVVGSLIQEYMPWEDEVAIICNEEGKMMGLPLNRGIRSDEGQLQDIIAGDFFLCYAPVESEKFLSMPKDLEDKYREKFDYPEQFFRTEDGIKGIQYDPGKGDRSQETCR